MNYVEILLTESLWYNTNVKINNNTVLYKEFALAGINQVCNLFDKFGKLIKFNDLVDKTGLSPSLFFKWMQLIDALPVNWKQAIKAIVILCNLIVFHFQSIPSILKRI